MSPPRCPTSTATPAFALPLIRARMLMAEFVSRQVAGQRMSSRLGVTRGWSLYATPANETVSGSPSRYTTARCPREGGNTGKESCLQRCFILRRRSYSGNVDRNTWPRTGRPHRSTTPFAPRLKHSVRESRLVLSRAVLVRLQPGEKTLYQTSQHGA